MAAFQTITEGKTRLLVPESKSGKGPGSKSAVFFNPAMASNRDVSVLYAGCRAKKGWRMLDALGGTGARGIRLAVEAPKMRIHINDRVPDAVKAIRKNIRLNDLKAIETSQQEVFALLPTGKWDWIDIDPYGSPIDFVDAAVQRLAAGGTLSVTATDTAPLCGTFSKACRRRYMARPMNSGCKHETGLRILAGNIVRRAAVMDIALAPELAYYQGHFFRCYFRKSGGAKQADALLKKIGYLELKDGEYSASDKCPTGKSWAGPSNLRLKQSENRKFFGKPRPAEQGWAGPLWIGNLAEKKLVGEMLASADDSMTKETVKLLQILKDELLQPPFHYHTDDLARAWRIEPPKTKDAIEILKQRGHRASPVHYSTKGFKTDAGYDEMRGIFG